MLLPLPPLLQAGDGDGDGDAAARHSRKRRRRGPGPRVEASATEQGAVGSEAEDDEASQLLLEAESQFVRPDSQIGELAGDSQIII